MEASCRKRKQSGCDFGRSQARGGETIKEKLVFACGREGAWRVSGGEEILPGGEG